MASADNPSAEPDEVAPVHPLPTAGLPAPPAPLAPPPENPAGSAPGFAELDSAVKGGEVSLEQIVQARRMTHPSFNPDPRARAGYVSRLPGLWEVFERRYGKVLAEHFAMNIPAAVVLTKEGGLHIHHPVDMSLPYEIEAAIWRAADLARRALPALNRPRHCLPIWMSAHSVVVRLLSALDARAGVPPGILDESGRPDESGRLAGTLKDCKAELDEARELLGRLALREASKTYLAGMALGMVALLALVGGLDSLVQRSRIADLPVSLLVGILMAGGIGAVVSVMVRMTTGSLVLDHHAGRVLTVLLGAFRPILGALFGLSLYVLIEADLLPLSGVDPQKSLFFYSGLALLAGFSERWAQDMLSAGVRGIAADRECGPSGRRRSRRVASGKF